MVWDDIEEKIKEANEQYSFSELKTNNEELDYSYLKAKDKESEQFNKQGDEWGKQQGEQIKIKSELNDHDTIFAFGTTKCGKTWAGCSFIEKCINEGGHAHIINNDNGVLRTMKAYFGKDFKKLKDENSFTIYPIRDIEEIFPLIEKLEKILTSKDLLFIDLLNDFYELSQDKFLEQCSKSLGVSITDYIVMASKDNSKFGLFDSIKWQYIKKLNNILMRKLVIYPKCTVFACNSVKDLKVREIFNKKDSKKLEQYERYHDVGYLPAGHDSTPSFFHTIVYIGQTVDNKHFFKVMGHRGFIRSEKAIYDKNFYNVFEELKK